jgi:hypothetical protein
MSSHAVASAWYMTGFDLACAIIGQMPLNAATEVS